jgi:hypothetical protein
MTGRVVLSFGLIVLFSAAAVLAYQAILWLHDGQWTALSLRHLWDWAGLGYPMFKWLGVQKIAVWVLDLPLSLALLVMGVASLWLGVSMEKA